MALFPRNRAPSVANEFDNSFVLTTPKYTFHDLILSDQVRDELNTVVDAQRCWGTVFETWGLGTVLKDRKNLLVNLYGESGTGKTMAAHAIAAALHKKLVCVNYADIESKYVGETSKNLKSLFTQPDLMDHIIFFDEADALLSKRVTEMRSASDVSVNQTRSVLLTHLNSYSGMVIFASNFISNYDVAFMRRIQYHIHFTVPDAKLRELLWQHYLPSQMPVQADISQLVKESEGLNGSDISTAVLKAALSAARRGSKSVGSEDFTRALESIHRSKMVYQETDTDVHFTKRIIEEKDVPLNIREQYQSQSDCNTGGV